MSQSRMTLRVAAYATACLVAASLLLGGYYAYQQQPRALAETGEVPTASTPTAIQISETALKNMAIGLQTAGPATLETTLALPGQIAVDEHRLKAVTSRFGGVILHMQKHVGQRVKQGELLAVLESRELADLKLAYLQQQSQQQQSSRQLQQQQQIREGVQRLLHLLQQKASFERIQKEVVQLKVGTPKATLLNDYTRLKNAAESLRRETQLYHDQLSSSEAFLQAKQAYEAAQASYMGSLEEIARTQDNQLYEAQLAHNLAQQGNSAAASKLAGMGIPLERLTQNPATALNRYEIYAPMSGTLIEKNVTEGDTVSAESALYKIADLSAVWAETQIYESDIPRVKVGSPVTIFAENQAHQAPGRLEHLKPFVNEETRTAEAHAEIPNPKGIWFPGMFITLKVQQQQKFVPLAVELKALQTLNQQTGVFVKSPEGFVFRPLTLGLQAENAVEVLSGLKAGERYVTDNSFVLKSEFLGQAE